MTSPFLVTISSQSHQHITPSTPIASSSILQIAYTVPFGAVSLDITIQGTETLRYDNITHKNTFFRRHLKVGGEELTRQRGISANDPKTHDALTGALSLRLPSHLQPSLVDLHRNVTYTLVSEVTLPNGSILHEERNITVAGSLIGTQSDVKRLSTMLPTKKTQSKSFDRGTVTCSVTLDRSVVKSGSELVVHCNVFNGSTAQVVHLSAALYSRYIGEDDLVYPPVGISKASFGNVAGNSELHSSRELEVPEHLVESSSFSLGRMALLIRKEYFVNLHVETEEGVVLMDIELPVFVLRRDFGSVDEEQEGEDADTSLYAEGLLQYQDRGGAATPERARRHEEHSPVAALHASTPPRMTVSSPEETETSEQEDVHQPSPRRSLTPEKRESLLTEESRRVSQDVTPSTPQRSGSISPRGHTPPPVPLHSKLESDHGLTVRSPRPRAGRHHHNLSDVSSRDITPPQQNESALHFEPDTTEPTQAPPRVNTRINPPQMQPPQLGRHSLSPRSSSASTPSPSSMSQTLPRALPSTSTTPMTDPLLQYKDEREIEEAVKQTRERLQEYQELFDSFGKHNAQVQQQTVRDNSRALTALSTQQRDYTPQSNFTPTKRAPTHPPHHTPTRAAAPVVHGTIDVGPQRRGTTITHDATQKPPLLSDDYEHDDEDFAPQFSRAPLSPYIDVNMYSSAESSRMHSPRFSPRYNDNDNDQDDDMSDAEQNGPQESQRLLNAVSSTQQNGMLSARSTHTVELSSAQVTARQHHDDDAVSTIEKTNELEIKVHHQSLQDAASGDESAEIPVKQGSIVYPDGSKYVGTITLEGSHRHGKGTLYYLDGSVYSGDFVTGKREGWGVFSTKSYTYDGEFKNDAKEGFGVIIYANGEQYEGKWQGGYPHGEGCYIFADGSKYVGNFERGLRNGRGVLHYSDGITTYDGEWSDDKKEGKAQVTFPNGKYVGEMRNDMKEGFGKYFYKNGSVFSGYWHLNQKHGKGSFRNQDGSTFVGTWSAGAKDGVGVFTDPSGVTYREKWKNGRLLAKRHAPFNS